MLVFWLTTALAAPCPDFPEVVDRAWTAFNDAELERAQARIAEASSSLACQERVVATEELLGLYRLDSLVSLAQMDREGAVYATIRQVTIDPEAAPGPELGPVIADLHATWADRLRETTVQVVLDRAGEAWVDGRPIPPDEPLEVIAGEHLVQVSGPTGWRSGVHDISEPVAVTGEAEIELVPHVVAPPPVPEEPPLPVGPRPLRRGLVIAGALGVAAGSGALAYGYTREVRFKNDGYQRDAFGDCSRDDACYGDERARAIRHDAAVVRGIYATGYALTGAGIVLLGTELFLLPDPARGGGSVRLRVAW